MARAISARKARKIRAGLEWAWDHPVATDRDPIHFSHSTFGTALWRERQVLGAMAEAMTDTERSEYNSLLMAGIFGFSNPSTTDRINKLEATIRRRVREYERETGYRFGKR